MVVIICVEFRFMRLKVTFCQLQYFILVMINALIFDHGRKFHSDNRILSRK